MGDIKGLSFVKEMFHLTVIIQSPLRVYSDWLQVITFWRQVRRAILLAIKKGGGGGGDD